MKSAELTHTRGRSADTVECLTVNVPEMAEMLGISIGTAWNRVWDGTIPSIKLGSLRRISRASVERLIDGEGK